MLVLSRHRDESILVGSDVIITVVDIRHDKVRLGIAAPVDVPVHREEVAAAIVRESAGKPAAWASRHRDAMQRLRDAIHLVVARGQAAPPDEVAARFTRAEWLQILAALGPEPGPRLPPGMPHLALSNTPE